MVTNTTSVDSSYQSTLKMSLNNFEEILKNTEIFTHGAFENIMIERRAEADRLQASMRKLKYKFFPAAMDKKIDNFLLALNAGANMCLQLQQYEKVPSMQVLPVDDFQYNFTKAYQQTLNEHVDLAKVLLMEKDIIAQIKEMNVATSRIRNLTRYVADPNNPATLTAVAEDARYVDNMASTRRNKRILGGLITLIGYGVLILSVTLGVAAATSLFIIGPVGIAGFAFSMGLTIAGNILRKLGTKMMHRPISKEKIIDMQDSFKLFLSPDSTSEPAKDTDVLISVNSRNHSSKN